MRRVPDVNLEFALLADGVPSEQVYEVLSTQEGLDRAFRKLDTIKDQVVWWEAGAQAPQLLADGEVAMSTAYNGRIFNAQVLENQPFVIVWDGQILDRGQLVAVTFIGPMASLMMKSVYDPDVADALPETMAALGAWDGQGTPPDEAFVAAAREPAAGGGSTGRRRCPASAPVAC